jgi:hypothetical protein
MMQQKRKASEISGDQAQGGEKTYLNCLFAEKDEAKALGARFDGDAKKWYVPDGVDPAPFAKWLSPSGGAGTAESPGKVAATGAKTWLNVPFEDKDTAKGLGALFDGEVKRWYVPERVGTEPFAKWIPTYLQSLSFDDNGEAKALRARFDGQVKKWYIPDGVDPAPFARWTGPPSPAQPRADEGTKTWLFVPFEENSAAKGLGARFDGDAKRWYVPESVYQPGSRGPFAKWIPAYLPNLSFDDKDAAKALGARFDGQVKKWYIPDGQDRTPFAKWM